ncbi:MAG: putative zinc-binding metallopeptidase [Bryobacteraceae bacterium]
MTVTGNKPSAFQCECGQAIYFRNSTCLGCGGGLGYVPYRDVMRRVHPAGDRRWSARANPGDEQEIYFRCDNLESPAACNWLIPAQAGTYSTLCVACGLNRTIPNLSIPGNAEKWFRIETAKRRLVASLIRLGLPVRPRIEGDTAGGLAFDFLEPVPSSASIQTGHCEGLITLNIEEAEAATREQIRARLRERYRTILGHLRHETGHYYWEVLVQGGGNIDEFRILFGDEQQDYSSALRRHYDSGPPAGWEHRYISAYATAHPAEDWAECWAHYLHMTDTLETADRYGLTVTTHPRLAAVPVGEPGTVAPERFRHMTDRWIELTIAANEISAAMGNEFFYPFTLSSPVIRKLEFIDRVVNGTIHGAGSTVF